MKQTNIIFLIFLTLLSCGSPKNTVKKLQLTTYPAQLELFVNQKTDPYSIHVEYTLDIPEGFVSPKSRLIYIPRILAPGHSYDLTPVIVDGKKFRNKKVFLQIPGQNIPDLSKARKIKATGKNMQIKIDETVPFQLWMAQARFIATAVLQERNSNRISTQTLAKGIVYLPLGPGPVRVKYVKREVSVPEKAVYRFLYPANVSHLRPELSDNLSHLNQLGNLLLQISHDPRYQLDRIVITGIGSPDGSQSYNEKLANKRANNFLRYLESGYGPFNKSVEVKTVAQDWQGLQQLVEQSDLPDKTAVLSILNSKRDEAQRIAALQRLPEYKYLLSRIYPQLQQTVCEVFYTVREIQTVPVPE